jgi:hypothetical protein
VQGFGLVYGVTLATSWRENGFILKLVALELCRRSSTDLLTCILRLIMLRKIEDGGWRRRVEGGGWRVDGGGLRLQDGG